jgi:hypothetical protein
MRSVTVASAALAALASLVVLSGCTAVTTVRSAAGERAVPNTVQKYRDAVNCLTEGAAAYPEGQRPLDFAYDLPPCVGRYLLEKSDAEIRESFLPGSNGSWLVSAEPDGDLAVFRVVTVGAGAASAGITSYTYQIAVCWQATIDTRQQTYLGSTDDECDQTVIDAFGQIHVTTLGDLTSAMEND